LGGQLLDSGAGTAVESQHESMGLAVDALAADGAFFGVVSHVAVATAENEESAGDVLGNGYHAHGGELLPQTGG
jgi:hypothetical protein